MRRSHCGGETMKKNHADLLVFRSCTSQTVKLGTMSSFYHWLSFATVFTRATTELFLSRQFLKTPRPQIKRRILKTFRNRCESDGWMTVILRKAAFAAVLHRIHAMHAFMEAGASSAASIALRAQLSELGSKSHAHAMQHVCVRACMSILHDRVLQYILKL